MDHKLFNEKALEQIKESREKWEAETLASVLKKTPEQHATFRTVSDLEIKRVYTPEDVKELDYRRDLNFPGTFPFTRGVYPTMYRGRLWTRRQIAGFGTARSTNQRYKFLLQHGQTGISTDFDHPTLTGYDSDHPLAEGEVGRLGVAIDTLRDMEELLEGIPLDRVSISLTINHPAIVLLSLLLAVAEGRGVKWEDLRGTVQNDSLKEFHGQKTFALPPRAAFKLTMDVVEYCTRHVPNWNTISISGYHTREAGATAVQELAFTLAQGMAYVEGGLERGLSVDEFAPRLSFFFGCHNDLFEEIGKFRAARRLWAKILKDRYGAKKAESLRVRFHTQTLGSTLVREQPKNNIVRGTLQALAAVLGGTQSLHVSGYDEAYDIPSEDAMRMSLRTQQIIGHESGVTHTIDPLAGSYFVESLTNTLEEKAWEYIRKIEAIGQGRMLEGMLRAIEKGYIEKEISEAAYRYQERIEKKDYLVVGVNAYTSEVQQPIEVFEFDPQEEDRQKERLEEVKKSRNQGEVDKALDRLRKAVEKNENLMPAILDAVKVYVTEGEIMGALRNLYGEYKDPAVF